MVEGCKIAEASATMGLMSAWGIFGLVLLFNGWFALMSFMQRQGVKLRWSNRPLKPPTPRQVAVMTWACHAAITVFVVAFGLCEMYHLDGWGFLSVPLAMGVGYVVRWVASRCISEDKSPEPVT
jgi:hypothetical protein